MRNASTSFAETTLQGRRLLFLQGPSSRFFGHLARVCKGLGGEVLRLGVAPADRIFWPRKIGRYIPYRAPEECFPLAFNHILDTEQPTDIVMLGDGRFHHKVAIAELRRRNAKITPWIVEHGYLRPNLLLVETWGTGGRSQIPAAFLQRTRDSRNDAQDPPNWAGSFLRYGALDVAANLTNLSTSWLTYRGYRHYAKDGVLAEYSGWVGKALRQKTRSQQTARALEEIQGDEGPIFLFPLQLDTDFQLRDHGLGEPQSETLNRVITSFAQNAPTKATLVIKVHPLDNGLARWDRQVQTLSNKAGIADRVRFIDGGSVEALMPKLKGVVTINSTVGLTALRQSVPVLALGRAIYSEVGLTHKGDLDAFWKNTSDPDQDLIQVFSAFIREHYHVPGVFDGPGALVGAKNVAERIARGIPP